MSWGVVAAVGGAVVGSYLVGSSGSSNDAAAQAQAAEDQRRKEIEEGQKRIEGIFSSPEREQQILDFIAAQRGYLQSDLDREHGENQRQLKFANARSGLAGGSVDVDSNRQLAETYLRGIAEAERMAQTSGASLRAEDQNAKQSLFSQLLAGADTGTAATNAAQMMQNNIAMARQDSTFNNFDSLFGDFGQIYKNSKEAAGERRASYEFGSLFAPRPRTQAQVSGVVG